MGNAKAKDVHGDFPSEILLHIFQYVPTVRDLLNCSLVCVQWYTVSSVTTPKKLYFAKYGYVINTTWERTNKIWGALAFARWPNYTAAKDTEDSAALYKKYFTIDLKNKEIKEIMEKTVEFSI
jgi:hypothetical protein